MPSVHGYMVLIVLQSYRHTQVARITTNSPSVRNQASDLSTVGIRLLYRWLHKDPLHTDVPHAGKDSSWPKLKSGS
jgi:hypothetical protein